MTQREREKKTEQNSHWLAFFFLMGMKKKDEKTEWCAK